MRKPLSIARLRDAINTRISKAQDSVDSFTGATNPQVRDMLLKSQGELEALELVRDAILQRTVYFLEH